MLRTYLLLLLLISCCTCVRAQSSEGNDFWFSFLQHRDPSNNMVALISARNAARGTISIPGTGWSRNVDVGANEVLEINLPRDAETLGSEGIRQSGVRLTTDLPVSLYIHQYFMNRSEASLVLPVDVLGTDHLVMAYTGRPNNSTNYPSAFVVVATQDDTEVSISDLRAQTEGGRFAGGSINLTLSQGQTYQVRANDALSDLTGTRITSSAPVAVFSGAAWSGVPADCGVYDNLLEITYPISQWGREYIGIPTLRNTSNLYRIMAAEDNTTVEVNGSTTLTRTLNAGEFTDFQTGGAVRITSDKPVLAAEFLLGSRCNGHPVPDTGDPSFFLLNEVSQTIDTVTVFNSGLQNIYENYLNVMFRTGDESSIMLDGGPIGVLLETAPGGEYSYYRIPVSVGSHTITSGGCGVIVTVYGYGDVESYSYGGGAAFRSINTNPIVEGGCLNDDILFATGLDTLRFKHEWTLEDGSIERRAAFTRRYDAVGAYPISVIITDECLGVSDTSFRDIEVTVRQVAMVSEDARACEGTSVTLRAVDLPEATYRWTGPNDLTEDGQEISVGPLTPEQAGTYSVIGDISGCKSLPAFVDITVDTTPIIRFTGDSTFCFRDNDVAMLGAGQFTAYRWSVGASTPRVPLREEGIYAVTVTNENGCVTADSVTVRAFCPTSYYVPTAFSPNGDGVNDDFGVFAFDATALQLEVFDRWGGLVFSSTVDQPRWDGLIDGVLAPAGTYVYQLMVTGVEVNGSPFQRAEQGTVVLVR